jgi:FkbM family methyltransferase
MSAHADHVFSFEPYEAVRNEMVRKLKHAGVDHVTIFPVALGDKTETAPYRPPTGANQGTGTLGSQLPDNASKDTIPVSVIRGDDFFAANNLPPITLLKLDVEGFEVNVLEGLRKTLLRDRPPILMEIQAPETTDLAARKNSMVLDLLYPDHLLFAVGGSRQRLVLGPFRSGRTAEALVLPMELAGILPGTSRY